MKSAKNGHLICGEISIPVRLLSPAKSPEKFTRQLHDKCKRPISRPAHCGKCKKAVPNEEVVGGFEHRPDEYVALSKEDAEALNPDSSKAIEVDHFVSREALSETLVAGPIYYVEPEESGSVGYAAMHVDLRSNRLCGLGQVVINGAERPYALLAMPGGWLGVALLHWASDVELPGLRLERAPRVPAEVKRTQKAERTARQDAVTFGDLIAKHYSENPVVKRRRKVISRIKKQQGSSEARSDQSPLGKGVGGSKPSTGEASATQARKAS